MAHLPTPGKDAGTWGDILNNYLEVSLNSNGTIKNSALTQAGGVTKINDVTPISGTVNLSTSDLDDVSLSSPTNGQVLTYDSTSGKWTNDISPSAPVTTVFGRTGDVVAQNGDYSANEITNAADKSSASAQAFTGNLSAPAFIATGLSGATSASRYVGATTSGAPTSGTFAVGDFVIDHTGLVWVCSAAGSPGTWSKAGAAVDANASDIQALGAQAAGSTGKAADAGHVHPTTNVATLSGATFSGYIAPAVVTLTDASTVTVNAVLGNDFRLTLTGSHMLGNPSGAVDGQKILFQITQDNSGSHVLSYDTAYEFSTGLPSPTLSTAGGATDLLGFIYNTAKAKWLFVAFVNGFS